MIAVDSNLLIRLFVDDDARQHAKAVAFFGGLPVDAPVYVNLVVLAEVVWLLSRRFGYARDAVLDALVSLLSNAGFVLQREDLVMAAIDRSRRLDAGYADSLIQCLNEDAGCTRTMTFDKLAAKRIPGMDLLK